ncbi:MAG: hypothetical protein PVI21_02870 [Candidatus Woesebacteria bacterium]|jgi:hypothetical protein
MMSFRSFFVSLASFISATCITILIWALALQTSIFNESVVKQGLSDSGVYNTFTTGLSEILQTQAAAQAETILTSDALADALTNTYTSDYIQTQAEAVLDSTYSWIDGDSSEINFNIPVDENRDVLVNELATQIEPELGQLQTCTALSQVSTQNLCIPANMTSEEFAKTLAAQAINSSGFASEPITSDSLNISSESSPFAQLPQYLTILRWSVIILAALAVVSYIVMLVISTEKIKSTSIFGRKLFTGALVPFCFGVAMFWLGSLPDGLPGMETSEISMANVVIPIMQLLLKLVGLQLLIFGGIFTAAGIAIWAGFNAWFKKNNEGQGKKMTQQKAEARVNSSEKPSTTNDNDSLDDASKKQTPPTTSQ